MAAEYRLRFAFEAGSGVCLWSADGRTWEAFGYPVPPAALPLPPETVAEASRPVAWHDRSLNWDYPPDPGPWRRAECDRFHTAAGALLERLRRELGPGFEVLERFVALREDPDLDTYRADPAGFRRSAGRRQDSASP